jgi:hypothetical protein
MPARSVFHAGRDVDRITVDTDRALGVALLADDHVAAVQADAKAGNDPE